MQRAAARLAASRRNHSPSCLPMLTAAGAEAEEVEEMEMEVAEEVACARCAWRSR